MDSGDGDVGNGGGSGNPGNGNTSISATISLDSEGKRKLEQIMEEKRQECGYAAMYNYLTYNNYKMNDIRINSSLSSSGRYNPQTNVMEFKSNDLIESAFSEEFIHFFQNMYYPGGTGQYAKEEGASNIEFEAKLLQDIFCVQNGGACPKYGASSDSKYSNEYIMWIESITGSGEYMPSYDDLLIRDSNWGNLNYWDFMENFIQGSPNYDYPIDSSLEPRALKYIYDNRCN